MQRPKRGDENTDSRKWSSPLCCCLFLAASLLKKDKHSMWYYQSLETSLNMYQHLSVQNISSFVFGHGLTAVVRKKSWLGWRRWAVTGRRQRGRKKRRKKRTCRAAAGPQLSHKWTSKIKTDSVALTYTNLHLFIGAALKPRPSPAQVASAIRMQRWAPPAPPDELP